MTTEWDQFYESYASGSLDWVNSLDRQALSQLKGEERERAIQLLLSELPVGSARITRALGVLPDPRVKAALEAHLDSAKGQDKVATARALLEQSPGHAAAVKAVKEALANPDLAVADEAQDAAIVAGPATLEALLAASLMQPDPHTRIGAIKAALFITGVNPSPLSWNHRDEIVALARGDRAAKRAAFASLCRRMNIDLNAYRGPRP